MIKIGRISGAAGLKGEVKLYHDSGDAEQAQRLMSFIIEGKTYGIQRLRFQKKTPIVKLDGVDDRDAAEALVGREVWADEAALREAMQDDGAFLVSDLVGCAVTDAADGARLGTVTGVIDNPAHDILEIAVPAEGAEDAADGRGRKILLPMVDVFVAEVNPAARFILVTKQAIPCFDPEN
ncbi:MAG: ribosome maturation factor RimM [Clostridiales Family XIII bacterium]|nr:ribosome maturation factor RimM [Clostridiales Family XIII bacterium]